MKHLLACILAGVAAFSPSPTAAQFNLYYGNFHSHCSLSDDATGPLSGPPDEAFAYARDVANIDVLALTDHSHYMSASEYSTLQSQATAFTQNGVFIAIAAQEHGNLSNTTPGSFGHMNVYEATTIIPQAQFREDLLGTYGWIASHVDDTIFQRLVGTFNHPYSTAGQGTWAQFQSFAWDSVGDEAMKLLEVLNGKRTASYEDEYLEALSLGWHVGALGNQDNHEGGWGDQVNNAGNIPLTGIWAPALTKGDILTALAQRRTFAMEVDPPNDRMSIKFTADGNWMGSEYSTSADSVDFAVEVSAVNNIASLSLFRNGTLVRSTGVGANNFLWNTYDTPGPGNFYYFVRVSQSDGDRAWTSPIWIESNSNFSQPLSVVNADNPDGTPTLFFQTVTVQGIVTVDSDTLSTTENRFFIQDATGGLMILDTTAGSQDVVLGHNVLVTGLVNLERGQTFVDPNPGGITILGQGEQPPPVVLTSNDVAVSGEAFEGSLAEIRDVTIISGTWPLPGANGSVIIDDGSGSCELFIDKDTSLDNQGAPQETVFSVRGIVTQNDLATPFNCCYRIMPRYTSDIFQSATDVTELPSHDTFTQTRLLQNWPNPFRPLTRLRFELAGTEEEPVQLVIYDVAGKRVRSLIDASIAPGEYEVTWDGRSDGGGRVAAGVYYYRLVTATSDETRKMVLLK